MLIITLFASTYMYFFLFIFQPCETNRLILRSMKLNASMIEPSPLGRAGGAAAVTVASKTGRGRRGASEWNRGSDERRTRRLQPRHAVSESGHHWRGRFPSRDRWKRWPAAATAAQSPSPAAAAASSSQSSSLGGSFAGYGVSSASDARRRWQRRRWR